MKRLNPTTTYETLKRFFPAVNDDFECDYVEEVAELRRFGITTIEQLGELLAKRGYEVLEIDRSPMDDASIRLYEGDMGQEYVRNRLKKGFWFAYPGLLRIALELEFGDEYRAFSRKRDGLEEPTDREGSDSED
jgi:hypothetical protein